MVLISFVICVANRLQTFFVKMKVILPEQALVKFTRACSPLAKV